MIVVSACLANIPCRFDGNAKPNSYIISLVEQGKAIPVCPEELGGLPTPRLPAEIQGNKIINKKGENVTSFYKQGAKKALKIALDHKCTQAILKSKSPSCGCGKMYDGSFTGKLVKGDGVFCSLLKQHQFKISTEQTLKS